MDRFARNRCRSPKPGDSPAVFLLVTLTLAAGVLFLRGCADRAPSRSGSPPAETRDAPSFLPDCLQPESLAPPSDAVAWFTVLDDDTQSESIWGHLTSHRGVIRKQLFLDVAPGLVREARVAYCIGHPPYRVSTRQTVQAADQVPRGNDLVVTVNGEEILRASCLPYITEGWHEIPVPPGFLRKGENVIAFGFSEPEPDDERYYAYFAIDTDATHLSRSSSSRDGGETFTFDSLRPGVPPKPAWQGEYLIRLRIAIPCEP